MTNTDRRLRLESAMDAMRRSMTQARERIHAGFDLTRTQLEIFMLLDKTPGQTTSELAKLMFLTQSAVTQTVDTMVRRGLIERRPDGLDRRIIRLHVSPEGKDLIRRLRDIKNRHLDELLSRLTADEAEALISALTKYAQIIEHQ